MKMVGRKVPTCCMGDRCCNAHDSIGRKKERRLAKRRERQMTNLDLARQLFERTYPRD